MKKLLIGLLALLVVLAVCLPAAAELRDQATGTGNISKTVTFTSDVQFLEFRLHLSDVGGANNLTVTIDSAQGAAYDVVILTQDMTAVTDLFWQPTRPIPLTAGDALVFAWTNSSGRTYGLEVIWK